MFIAALDASTPNRIAVFVQRALQIFGKLATLIERHRDYKTPLLWDQGETPAT